MRRRDFLRVSAGRKLLTLGSGAWAATQRAESSSAVPAAHEEANKWVSPLGSFRIHPHLQRPVDLFERRASLN
jgi:hypothetical protein